MRSRALLILLGSALCLALIVVGPAVADPLTDVTQGLSSSGLPNVDVPPVPPVEVPHTGVQPVDGVVDTVNGTVAGATDAANDLTAGLGGGDGTAQPPATETPTPTGSDPAGQPVQTGSPAPAETGPSSPSGPASGAGSNQSSRPNAAGGAGAGGAAAAGAATSPRSRPGPPATSRDQPGPSQSPFVAAFDSLPWSLFALIAALALIGLFMSGRSAAKARLNGILRKQRGELQEDVGALQSALLPAIPERIGETELGVAYRPAEGPAAGGDFHDVLALADGRIGIVVGDVCGHGREALANTALVHYTVRAYLEAGLEPREALRLANEALSGKLEEAFVAVVAAVYDPAASTLDYATAGHPTPLIAAERDRSVGVLTPPPIGVGLHTGHRQTRISVRAGSRVWFFTDGLVEARDADGEMLGRDGLAALLIENGDAGPEALLASTAGLGETRDDMTVVVLAADTARGDGTVEEEIDVDRELAGADGLPRFLAACGLDPGEVERAVEAAKRRLRLAGSARIRTRSDGIGPNWEISGAPAPRPAVADGAAPSTSNGSAKMGTILTGSPN